MTMIKADKILLSIFAFSTLCAQQPQYNPSVPATAPLYILLNEPLSEIARRDIMGKEAAGSVSVLSASAERTAGQRRPETPFFESERFRELKRWTGYGAVAGFTAGFIIGIIKVRSLNDGALFGVPRPLMLVYYCFNGIIIGGMTGAVTYLILEFPESDENE